jgi:uncharacterized OB-fold protein
MPDASLPAGARGTLVTFTVIRKAPAAFAGEPLYAVAIVDLDAAEGGHGHRVIGRIEPFDPAPRLGAPVELVRWAKETPVFAPRKD